MHCFYTNIILFLIGYTGPRDTIFFYRAKTLMAVRYKDFKAHFVTRSGWGFDPPEVCEHVYKPYKCV